MSPLSLVVLILSVTAQSIVQCSTNADNLTVYEEPNEVRPYVIPYLRGFAVQAFGYVVGFPVTNVSTAGAISLITVHGKKEPMVPVHYHSRYHETFFVAKGAINLFAQNETRRLGPLDIGSVPPNTNHSFELLEPDTEIIGAVTPGGFSFYQQVGDYYAPEVLSPFPTDDPNPPANLSRVEAATGLYYDYNPTNYQLNFDMTNGTTDSTEPWHTGNNYLPQILTPYYVAGGWGPKYLHRELGQVVHLYMTGQESNNAMTIATLTMRAARANETEKEWSSESVAQLFRVLEGQLYIKMLNQTAVLGTGDTAVVPQGVRFSYWSNVAFTRVYTVAAAIPGVSLNTSTFGVVHDLLAASESWDYAIFPDHY